MRKWTAVLLLLVTAGTHAEVRLSAAGWRDDLSGRVDRDGQTLDFERDLDAQADAARGLRAEWDTGRWWPDLSAATVRSRGSGHVSRSGPLSFGPIVIPGSATTQIDTDASYDDTELAARWPLAWGPLRVSLGLAAKWLDGEVRITDTSDGSTSRQRYRILFPEAHTVLAWRVWPGLQAEGVAQGLSYRGDRAMEWRALLRVTRLAPLLVEGGWQQKRYRVVDDDGAVVDARLAGPWLALGLAFGAGR
ncbi:MAG TPA: hypothetical protein VM369_06450 [Candidatus Binatia bacterium]|nr:hypothetical protein [Candidatus Binatia bacterium]